MFDASQVPATPTPTIAAASSAVYAAAHAYETALVDGDTEGAASWFAPHDPVSRFGPEGAQLDRASIESLRANTLPQPAPNWIHDEVRVLAPGVAVHLAVIDRGGVTIHRTQLWVETSAGWRIGHAHVSKVPS